MTNGRGKWRWISSVGVGLPVVKDVDGGRASGWREVVMMEATGTKSWGKESGLRYVTLLGCKNSFIQSIYNI